MVTNAKFSHWHLRFPLLFIVGIIGPLESRLEDFYAGSQNAGQNKILALK